MSSSAMFRMRARSAAAKRGAEDGGILPHPDDAVSAESHGDLPHRKIQGQLLDGLFNVFALDNKSGAEHGMAGEINFDFGHEDADVVAAVHRRIGGDEGGLGKVDLFRQLLHEGRGRIPEVDRQLIARIFMADGEDINDVEFHA